MRRALLIVAGGVALGWLAAYLEDYWYVAHAPKSGMTPMASVTVHHYGPERKIETIRTHPLRQPPDRGANLYWHPVTGEPSLFPWRPHE